MTDKQERVVTLIVFAILMWAWFFGFLYEACSGAEPDPAIVRVIATDRVGSSLGSGVFVAASETHGLVLTNYHVVKDRAGKVFVKFPDGTKIEADVIAEEKVWDLAALEIELPDTDPIPLASRAPTVGQPLAIAGYGGGEYLRQDGKCTGYMTPRHGLPREWVVLSVRARKGDSGGPILNADGKVAGVLWGSSPGITVGSSCIRVKVFIDGIDGHVFQLEFNLGIL